MEDSPDQSVPEASDTLCAQFIYSYKHDTNKLYRTDMTTNQTDVHQIPSYKFKIYSCWSPLPDGNLLITGGGSPSTRQAVLINTRTFEKTTLPHMLSQRAGHCAVYHGQQVYVLGGFSGVTLNHCERYSYIENRWVALPPLPKACCEHSGVVQEGSLYILGGYDHRKEQALDYIQRFSLDGLYWELLPLRLPQAATCIPCFKVKDGQVYFVLNKTLFTLSPLLGVRSLGRKIYSWYGPSYSFKGKLYCSDLLGSAFCLQVGALI
jgi:hypothetical protein